MGFWLLVPGVGMGAGTGPDQSTGRLEFTFSKIPEFTFGPLAEFTFPKIPDETATGP